MEELTVSNQMANKIRDYLNKPREVDQNEDDEELNLEDVRVKESLDDVLEYIESLGGEAFPEDMETNGWQWDVWVPFKYNETDYELSFCGYYNNGMKIFYKED